VLAGVGAVVIFLPQIVILFFFIGILEDSGYMARAAFLMDRMMSRVGLHGRAFIPLMSSFACAIPGIMATRTISSRRDRMTTILIAPLMSCSARLPVYYLMITAFIPNRRVLGMEIGGRFIGFSLRETVIFSMYVLGIVAAMLMAWLFKKTLFKGPPPPLLLELPPYKMPAWKNVLITMWDRASQFLKRAGTTILAISVILWFLLSYPKIDVSRVSPQEIAAARLSTAPQSAASTREASAPLTDEEIAGLQTQHSFAGTIGRTLEPLIKPLGFNWKIGIGLIGAMSAREVFVSTIGNVYSVGEADETSSPLRAQMMRDRWPDGTPVWTPVVGIAILVYFVLAMQCVSTLAVVRRETNSWKWPAFMLGYMTVLAWVAAFIVYQVGTRL
jgi:ferrous iron transport protein B